jgi:hypothetical protein
VVLHHHHHWPCQQTLTTLHLHLFLSLVLVIKSVFDLIPIQFVKLSKIQWTLNKNKNTDEKKVVNKTRLDEIRYTDITSNKDILPCIEYIEQQRLKWFGQLVRMQHGLPAAQAFNCC